MTVRQLMRCLRELDPNAEVRVVSHDNGNPTNKSAFTDGIEPKVVVNEGRVYLSAAQLAVEAQHRVWERLRTTPKN